MARKSSRTIQKRATSKKPARGKAGVRPGPIGNKAQQAAVRKTFLEAYAETGIITRACEAAGITRRTHYDWLEEEEYAAAFLQAEEEAADILEEEARRRAVDGVEEPVGFYQGVSTTNVQRYSDTLLKFMLEGKRRSIFGRRTELSGPDGGPVTIVTKIERVIVYPEEDK